MTLTNRELQNLDTLLIQYGLNDETYALSMVLSEKRSALADHLLSHFAHYKWEEAGRNSNHYLIKAGNRQTGRSIEKTQIFKHIFSDLIELQDYSYPVWRAGCSISVFIGFVLLFWVISQGMYSVFIHVF